jgi:hypothetical protein
MDKEILKDLYERLTSRTFVVLVVSIVLFVLKVIDLQAFLAINGVSFGGSTIKDLTAPKVSIQAPDPGTPAPADPQPDPSPANPPPKS